MNFNCLSANQNTIVCKSVVNYLKRRFNDWNSYFTKRLVVEFKLA